MDEMLLKMLANINLKKYADAEYMLEGLERVTSFRALYRFTNVDKENRTAVLDGKTVYNIYIYGDNVFFK